MTQRDDIVLDPFLGSGSTLIAADPCYVDVILCAATRR